MSIPIHEGSTDFTSEASHHEPLKPAALLPIYVALLVLTCAQIFVGLTVGEGRLWVNLTITVIQICVIAYFFMDLRHSDRLTWLSVGAAGFWTAILFVITLTDYFTRHYWAH